jgi:hypothetical protein
MKPVTRKEAIDALRAKFLTLVDDEHSMCDVAARLHLFCGGFAQWTFLELKKRYPMIVRSRPRITPRELKELANRWQLARQQSLDADLSCDAQLKELASKQTCHGWNEFTNAELEHFHHEIVGGDEIQITDADTSAATRKG